MKKPFGSRFIILALFIIVLIIFHGSGARSLLTFDNLKSQSEYLREWVSHHYVCSVFTFLTAYFLNVALSLPGAFLLTMTAGFLYGTLVGACYSVTGATLGALAGFLIVRYGIGDFIQERYKNKLVWFNNAVERYGVLFLLGIHLVAVVPLVVVNILAGISKVPTWTFIWTTALSIIPLALVYSYAGSQLQNINSARDIFTGKIVLTLAVLAFAACLPVILARFGFKKPFENK